ncbi:MAG: DUF2520 domain-containing protein [Bacteroidales bacterium]
MIQNITIIGSGNVASWFAHQASIAGIRIVQIYSRQLEHAQAIASIYQAQAIDHLKDLSFQSDLFLFSLKDDLYEDILKTIPTILPFAVHTAGSVSLKIFQHHAQNFGVLYPYQTISKTMDFNQMEVPLCVEGNRQETDTELLDFALRLSPRSYLINEEQRFTLHLAAVFASNFTNALYTIAHDILQKQHINWEIILPLLQNTLNKTRNLTPVEAQTGPAVREDFGIMQKQLASLDSPALQIIYRMMSEYIIQHR